MKRRIFCIAAALIGIFACVVPFPAIAQISSPTASSLDFSGGDAGGEPVQNGWALLLVGSLMLLIGCLTIRIFRKNRWIACPLYLEGGNGNGRDACPPGKGIAIKIN